MTRVCIFGAGAIGGMMAAAFDKAGAEVSLVARGPHLAAIQEKGLVYRRNVTNWDPRSAAGRTVQTPDGGKDRHRTGRQRPALVVLL